MTQLYTIVGSPIGELLLGGDGDALSRLWFLGDGVKSPRAPDPAWRRSNGAYSELREQLEQYFAGERRQFDVELDLRGTEWERRVWSALLAIPYGASRSYGEIAASLCTVAAARAVGLANGRNPIALIVPCHRVIGSDGRLTGYGGGLERKRALLDLEAGRLALTASGG